MNDEELELEYDPDDDPDDENPPVPYQDDSAWEAAAPDDPDDADID